MSKILFFDIETSPNVVYTWSLGRKINISAESLIEERKIICICFKYLGDDNVYSLTWDKDQNDKDMVEAFLEELNSCDVAIGHNGDNFDVKWVKTRALVHGLNPSNLLKTVDTLKLARQNFKFNSNRLDYIGKYLELGGKKDAGGFDTWKGVLAGDKQSLETMVDYCAGDVELLERVYLKMLPHVKNISYHAGMLNGNGKRACDKCGGDNFINYGKLHSKTGTYQKLKCNSCNSVIKGGKL